MKKYTNKILLIAAIVFTLSLVIGLTLDFQIQYHKNPEKMMVPKKFQQPNDIILDDSNIIDVEDSVENNK